MSVGSVLLVIFCCGLLLGLDMYVAWVRPHGGGDFHLLGREDVVVGFVVVIAIAHLVMMVTK